MITTLKTNETSDSTGKIDDYNSENFYFLIKIMW